MQLYARQGDLVFEKATLSGEFEKKAGLVLAGHDSAPHTIRREIMFRRNGEVTELRIEKTSAVVSHAGRHVSVKLEPGDYVVRPLRERHGSMDRAVQD